MLKEDLIKIAKKQMMLIQKVSQDVQKGEKNRSTQIKTVAGGTDDIIKMDCWGRSQRQVLPEPTATSPVQTNTRRYPGLCARPWP